MDRFISVTEENLYWQEIYDIAKNDKLHNLHKNYTDIDLNEYEHMIVHLHNEKPISFHGIYNNNRWPNNISRVCNRLYTLPEYRDNLCTTTGMAIKFDCDNYDKWNKDILIISRGCQYNDIDTTYKKFSLSVRWANKYTGYNWVHDDKLYKCCGNNTPDCFQFILWYDPKNLRQTIDIPYLTIEEYKKLQTNSL